MVVAVAVVCENFSSARDHVFGVQGSLALDEERLFENRKRKPQIAVGLVREILDGRIGDIGFRKKLPNPFPIGFEVFGHVRRGKRFENENFRTGEKRPDDGEARIFGRRADQRHDTLFDVRQERVLLGFVPTVDFIEKEDRFFAFEKVLARFRDDLGEVLLFAYDAREMEEFGVDGFGNEVCQTRFSGSRRSPENHGNETSRFENLANGRPFADKGFLSGELAPVIGS
jgi:hypothetical protein